MSSDWQGASRSSGTGRVWATCWGALDLLVITSRTEGMSNTMLEALAAGLPVVSTPVSGAREALEPLTDGRRPGASWWSRSRKRWRQA